MVAVVSTFYKKLPDEIRKMTYSKITEAYTYVIYYAETIKEGLSDGNI